MSVQYWHVSRTDTRGSGECSCLLGSSKMQSCYQLEYYKFVTNTSSYLYHWECIHWFYKLEVAIRMLKSSNSSKGFEMILFLVVSDRANTRICLLNWSTGFPWNPFLSFHLLPIFQDFISCLWINNFMKDVKDYNHSIARFLWHLYSLESWIQKANTYHA